MLLQKVLIFAAVNECPKCVQKRGIQRSTNHQVAALFSHLHNKRCKIDRIGVQAECFMQTALRRGIPYQKRIAASSMVLFGCADKFRGDKLGEFFGGLIPDRLIQKPFFQTFRLDDATEVMSFPMDVFAGQQAFCIHGLPSGSIDTSITVTGIPDGVVGSHVLALAAHPRLENQKLIFVVVLATVGDAVIYVQRTIRLADHCLILHHIVGYIENRELQKSSQTDFVLHSLRDGVAHNPEFIAAFQQFVPHSQTLFPLLRHCVIQVLCENRVRRQGNHAAGCRISTVVLCLFHVLFHISPQRGRNIDQPQSNTYLSKLSPSTQQTDGAKVAENCTPATEDSLQTSEFQISKSSSSSKSQVLSTSEP